jgi:Tfp pilus assembly protein PilF
MSAVGSDRSASRAVDDLLQRAVASLAKGEAQAALEAASAACQAAPDRPEAHYIYGQAWSAVGAHATAERAFAEALRLRPLWADAWVNYGLARYRQNAIEDAKTAMVQALRADPAHPAATANLGAFLRLTGASDQAESLLRAALRRDPGQIGARLNLVADLLQEERPADALALLDEVASPEELHPARHWHLQRALALVALDRPGEARAAVAALDTLGPVPPELAPLRHWRLVLIALAEGHIAAAQAEAQTMAVALDAMGPSGVLEHRIMGHYDLAKFWSRFEANAEAFAHWRAGHALLKPLQPFSRESAKAFTDANIAAFDAARFAQGPRAQNADAAPVFIVGMPRSGTTLCEQIIGAHRETHGAGERVALQQAFVRLAGGLTPEGVAQLTNLPQTELDNAADAYLAELHALAPEASRVLDKMPGNYRFLGLVGLLFPKARIVHCVRDPRDIGLSIFTFRFHGEHGYAHDLADLGWEIAEQERLMAHWTAVLSNPILTVALSDWVYDFDATLARVLAHLDLPHDDACTRFHETELRVRTVSRSQVRQPINARGLGRWKTYERELAPLIAELDKAGTLARWMEQAARRRAPL